MLNDASKITTANNRTSDDVGQLSASRPKSLISNALWNTLLTIWTTSVSFFLTPFLIAHIGADYYGIFVLLMSINGVFGVMNLGLGEATLRYVAHYYARSDLAGINRVIGATFSVYAVTGLLGWVILFFGASWLAGILALSPTDQELGTRLLRLAASSFALGLIGGALGSIPQALQRYDVYMKVMIAQSIFQTSGMVVIILAGMGIYQLVLWTIVTLLFTQVVNVVIVRRLIPNIRLSPRPSKTGLREVFGYGIFSLIRRVLNIIWGQADRLLLGVLVSPAAVAYLTVPQNLAFQIINGVNSTGAVLFPRFSTLSDRQATTRLFLHATWLMLCATIVLFVPITVLLPDFLRLWISPQFATESAWIGQVIAASCLVRGAFVPYEALFKGTGKPQYLSALYLGSGLTSFFLNVLLIPKFGLAGAGYCYAVTVLWGFLAIAFAWRRVLASASFMPILRAVVVPSGLGIASLVLGGGVRAFVEAPGWVELFVLGILFSSVTAGVLTGSEWFLGGRNSYARTLFHATGHLILTLGTMEKRGS